MIYDKEDNRLILRSGKTMIPDRDYCLRMIKGESLDNVLVTDSEDAEQYEFLYNEEIIAKESDDEWIEEDTSFDPLDENYVLDRIYTSPRYKDTDEEDARLEQELEYFDRTMNYPLLFALIKLVDQFKKDGVVWGVGRGSSCASYVLYLLEVHDVDPLLYNIPFTEMSKE